MARVHVASGKVQAIKVGTQPAAPDIAAITSDGKYCLVTDYVSHVVWVYTLSPFELHRKVSVGLNPHGIVVTPDKKRALVTNKFSHSLAFLDLSTFKVEKTIKTGAVPLDTVVDPKGTFAYQSQFVGSVIKKIDLAKKSVVDTFPVQFRPGHLAITPDGKYLLVLNKYSTGLFKDRKVSVTSKSGTVVINNFQVIDLQSGKIIAHAPVTGEPFGAVILARSAVKDPGLKSERDFLAKGQNKPDLPKIKGAKVSYIPVKDHKPGVFDAPDGTIEVYISAFSHQFAPNVINVFEGDPIRFIITNIDEKAPMINHPEITHGFTINGYGEQVHVVVPRGVSAVVEFMAEQMGEYNFYCSTFCSFAHMEMRGRLVVE